MTRKKKSQKKLPAVASTDAILTDLFKQVVSIDGKKMSVREAMLRSLSNRSLAGDVDASLDLQKLRDQCGVRDEPERIGCLLVPEPFSEEEFEKLVYEQQAQFRDKNYGKFSF